MQHEKDDTKVMAFYDQYQKPSVKWLNEKLEAVKLGWLKASEMEIYLAYMQMYSRNHLHRDPFEIADIYGYTESKVAKLQIEFARRFINNENESESDFLKRIYFGMLSQDGRSFINVDNFNGRICFSVKNASDVRRIKRIAAEKGLVVGSVVNNSEFALQPHVFALLFMLCDESFKSQMENYVKREGKKISDVFPSTKQLITRMGVELLKRVASDEMTKYLGGFVSNVKTIIKEGCK